MSGFTVAMVSLGLLAAYLLGSIPTGFVLGKALKGIDIREHGSGNTGATNVFRVIGKGAGTTALAIDLVKGFLAVRLMMMLVSLTIPDAAVSADPISAAVWPYWASAAVWPYWACMLAALLAVLGHSRSVWLGFSGGKSAATGLGVLLALVWPVGLGALLVFGLAVGISRTVSVGSIAAALSAMVFMLAMQQPLPYVLLAIAGGCYVVFRHRSNISRLMAGTEPKTFGG